MRQATRFHTPQSPDRLTFDLQRFDNPGGTDGNITWEIVDDVLIVSGTGATYKSPWQSYRNQITSVVVNEGITQIGDGAFQGCTNLTSVSLPSTVTDIASTAFSGCENLQSVTITMPSGKMITYAGSQRIFADVNGTADITEIVTQQHTFSFADLPSGTCGENLTWAFDGHKLTISGTGAMGDNTFNDSWWYYYRDAITTVEIGDGVTSIGEDAFYDCQNLQSVTIPATLETIGGSAFYNCQSLPAMLDLSGTRLTTIGDYEAFSTCTSLERMILPDTVTYIGRYAFQNCADNLSVVIVAFDDEKVTMGGKTLTPTNGYIDITSLVRSHSKISYSIGGTCGDNLTWAFDGGKLTISGNGEMSFTEAPWKNRLAQITSVEIGSGVTKIIGSAFNDCENLQSVTVAVPSDKTLTINGTEYTPSSGTVNITPLFADDLTDDLTISSFYGGTSDNITWKLTDDGTLTISGTGEIYNFPWQSYRNQIKTVVIGEGITFISGAAFYRYSNLTSVILPEGTTALVGYELLNDSELLDGLKSKYLSTGVTLATAAASEVTYTDANGNPQTVLAFALGNDSTVINRGTYFVTGTVNLESLTINGDARIILGDGAKLNVSGEISTKYDLLICGSGEVTAGSFSAASVTFDRNFSDGTNLYKSGNAYSISADGTFTAFDVYELDILLDGAEIFCANDDKITLGDKTYYKGGATITITIPDGEKLLIDGNEVSGTVEYTMPAQDTLLTEPASIGELNKDADGNEYYSVTKAIHLVTLAEQVNGGERFEGVTFKLEKDIDLSKIENFTPIGFDENNNYDYWFSGTFDGGGHKISGLTINLPDNECVGLFGYVIGGTVKNVALENVNVTGGSWGVGALIGYYDGGKVENCSVIGGTVSGEDGVGGLVGDSNDDTCIISGNTVSNVSVSATGSKAYVGGLVGDNDGSITGNTVSNVSVSATGSYAWVGGLVGDNDGSITGNTVSGGTVTATIEGGLKGGLVGNNYGGTVTGNTVDAQITVGKDSWVGGLVGDNYGGTVTGNTVDAQITAGDDSYVGGVVGCDEYNESSSSTVKNNFFHSTAGDVIGGYDDYDGKGADIRDNERLFALKLPEGVTASGDGVKTVNGKLYAAGSVTLNAPEGYTLNNITVNGTTISGNTFTISDDTNINVINNNDPFKATAVIVGGTTGDFHAYSSLYTITASQENSTLIANAKANQIIVAGGNENILTGGKGNDTFNFSAGGGIVTDYGIGATKSGDGKTLSTASGTDIVKVDGKVTGIYFDRNASSKKSATFTATITYTDTDAAEQVIVLKDIAKKPTKTNSNLSKAIYQTNDVAAATLKIWDTSSNKQAVISATNLKKLFHDDSDSAFTEILQAKTNYLVDISKGNTPENNPFTTQLTFTGNNKN